MKMVRGLLGTASCSSPLDAKAGMHKCRRVQEQYYGHGTTAAAAAAPAVADNSDTRHWADDDNS